DSLAVRPLEFFRKSAGQQRRHLPIIFAGVSNHAFDSSDLIGMGAPPRLERRPPLPPRVPGETVVDPASVETAGRRRYVYAPLIGAEPIHTAFAEERAPFPLHCTHHLEDRQARIVVSLRLILMAAIGPHSSTVRIPEPVRHFVELDWLQHEV